MKHQYEPNQKYIKNNKIRRSHFLLSLFVVRLLVTLYSFTVVKIRWIGAVWSISFFPRHDRSIYSRSSPSKNTPLSKPQLPRHISLQQPRQPITKQTTEKKNIAFLWHCAQLLPDCLYVSSFRRCNLGLNVVDEKTNQLGGGKKPNATSGFFLFPEPLLLHLVSVSEDHTSVSDDPTDDDTTPDDDRVERWVEHLVCLVVL